MLVDLPKPGASVTTLLIDEISQRIIKAFGDIDAATAAQINAAIAGLAPLASPTFTGDPKAPTPLTADNDTSIATTAFVKAALAAAGLAPVPGKGTSFPGSPTDGQEFLLDPGYGNGTLWRFRYNAGSGSPYKWEFIGGPEGLSRVDSSQTGSSTSLGDLATAGPSIGAPRAGEYIISGGATATIGAGSWAVIAYQIGINGQAIEWGYNNSSGATAGVIGEPIKITVAQGDVVKMQYRTTANPNTWQWRRLSLLPIRCS